MSSGNHRTTACVFKAALQTLLPDGVNYDKVLSLVTNDAPYMKKQQKDFRRAALY
jgi:hypothetical protein